MSFNLGDNNTFPSNWPPDNGSIADFGNASYATTHIQAEATPVDSETLNGVDALSETFFGSSIFDDPAGFGDNVFGDSEMDLPLAPLGNDFPYSGGAILPSLNTLNSTMRSGGGNFLNQSLPTIIEDPEQNISNDSTVLPDQLGLHSQGNQAYRQSMARSARVDADLPSRQARGRLRPISSKLQKLKRNFTSYSDDFQSPKTVGLPSSGQEMKDAICLLEINYRFKPHPTEEQMHALAVWVGLTYEEVRNFFEQKWPLPVSHKARSIHSRQSLEVSTIAKRARASSPSSQSELIDSGYGTHQSEYSISFDGSERSNIPRFSTSYRQSKEPSVKPFECTWSACYISFASKSDWIRHEEWIHCPQNEWECTLPSILGNNTADGGTCTRIFKRDDKLRSHLKKDHECCDESRIRVGRREVLPRSPFRKQCGFCGWTAINWSDRMNHIADHFNAGKHMSEWKDPWPQEDSGDESDSNDDNESENNDDDGDGAYNNESTDNGRNKPPRRQEDRGEDAMDERNMGTGYGGSRGFDRRPGHPDPGSRDHASLDFERQHEAVNRDVDDSDSTAIAGIDDDDSDYSAIRENKIKEQMGAPSAGSTNSQEERAQTATACIDCSQNSPENQNFMNFNGSECLKDTSATKNSEMKRVPRSLSEIHLKTSVSKSLVEGAGVDLRSLKSRGCKSTASEHILSPEKDGLVMQQPDHQHRQESRNLLSNSTHRYLDWALVSVNPGDQVSWEVRARRRIAEEIRIDALQLLRKYHREVLLNLSGLSKASRTSSAVRNEASIRKSIADMTLAWSVDNAPVKPEPAWKPLDPVTRAKKALLRKLGACHVDCRKRFKVKCQLWHHSLHDLLEIDHEPLDEEIVEWAMKPDAEPPAPANPRQVLVCSITPNLSYSDKAVDGIEENSHDSSVAPCLKNIEPCSVATGKESPVELSKLSKGGKAISTSADEIFETKKTDEVRGDGSQKNRFKNVEVAKLSSKSSWENLSNSSFKGLAKPPSTAASISSTNLPKSSSLTKINSILLNTLPLSPAINRYAADITASNPKCTLSSAIMTKSEAQAKAKARMLIALEEFDRVWEEE